MSGWLRPVQVQPRLYIAAAIGIVVAAIVPGPVSAVTRLLFGWNTAVWLYLALIGWMIRGTSHIELRRFAIAHAERAGAVLGAVIAAAVASVAAIIVELAAAKGPGASYALPHVLLALSTVAGSWLLLPTLFSLTYASRFYRSHEGPGVGLAFPGFDEDSHPDYWDFLYFSFTIAAASQTADVAITNRSMRKLVLLQSVLSFAFNTTILALTVNIAAGLF